MSMSNLRNYNIYFNDLKNQQPPFSENTHEVNYITENVREAFLESCAASSLYDFWMEGP